MAVNMREFQLTYAERLDKDAATRYSAKMKLLDLTKCPYEDSEWINDCTKWPCVTYPDIYHYLTEMPGQFTRSALKAYKSLESYNYFESGFVSDILVKTLESGNVILKCQVKHGQKSDPPCMVWTGVTKDGSIIACHCNCMAGLGEACSHIGAMLFKVEAFVRHGYTKEESCTSKECKWNQQFRKKVQPAPFTHIDFSTPRTRVKETPQKQTLTKSDLTCKEQEDFFLKLHQSGMKSVVLTTHDTFYEFYKPTPIAVNTKKLPVEFKKYFQSQITKKAFSKIEVLTEAEKMFEKLSISTSEVDYVELVTRNQADSIVWHEQRVGKITASKVYDVLRTDIKNPSKSLLREISTTNYNAGLMNVPSLKYGREHEIDGVDDLTFILSGGVTELDLDLPKVDATENIVYQYTIECPINEDENTLKTLCFSSALKLEHSNWIILKCGLHLSSKYPFLAATPDRVVSCDCCGKGAVEIKCPFSHEKTTDSEVLIAQYFYPHITLKIDHPYYHQIQTQMNICEYDYAYFVIWTPNITIVSVETRNAQWFQNKIDKLRSFFLKHIIPIFITDDLEWGSKEQHKLLADKENIPTYCVCDGIEDNRTMVRCSNFKQCNKKWFHLDCLNMSKAPKGRWLCPYCKK